jgi:hypothetical protein
MPFAIRIFGDAAIVAVLHQEGFDRKTQAVWGRRLVMDCFKQIPANTDLTFTLSLSERIFASDQTTRIVHFESSCGNCQGSIVMVY